MKTPRGVATAGVRSGLQTARPVARLAQRRGASFPAEVLFHGRPRAVLRRRAFARCARPPRRGGRTRFANGIRARKATGAPDDQREEPARAEVVRLAATAAGGE